MASEREPLFEVARRTFDTPEFRGIEFIESECKTIINHVPGKYLPFNWTINPYRGCSHACSYCSSGDTPILLLDGRTKPIAELQVGDEIYGTARRGGFRKYVPNRVLAHWSTVKPAYRLALEDGTELVTSGDHRFLSNRGWKHVTGAWGGPLQRPHLTTNNKLVGTGRFSEPPTDGPEYRRGYLCGMVRGDASLGSYTYRRRSGARSDVHRLVDLEALQRTRSYLARVNVPTTEFVFQRAVGAHQEVVAIRNHSRAGVDLIRQLIAWPDDSSDEWAKGFLAGIFDAEGSYSGGVLRIGNTDPDIIRWIAACLTRFGFDLVVETQVRAKPMMNVRVRGGMAEHLRFFHTVDPAITRKRSLVGRAVKHRSRLRVVSIEPLGVELPMYDITTETGDFIANGVVSHNCFARPTHTYLDMDAGRDFETKIVVKVNAPQVLRAQLGSKRWKGEHIAMGTATDPYQRAEGRYGLMREIIGALTDYRNPFSILTKGTLILRDLDLLQEAAKVTEVSTSFSIGTLDDEAWRLSEPGTPHPRARMDAVAALNDAGIPCGILMAPILPGITDDPAKLRKVVKAAIDAGATHVSPILLHLRPGVREEFMPWLAEHHPDLVERYESLYAAGSGYAAKANQRVLGDSVRSLITEAGGVRLKPGIAPRFRKDEGPKPPSVPPGEQMSLLDAMPTVRKRRAS